MEENNIFNGAKFGYPFTCQNGLVANFICATKFTTEEKYCLYVEGADIPYWYNSKGENLLHKTELNIKKRLNHEG